MAANWAKKEEFTVGWGFYPNNNTSATSFKMYTVHKD